MIGKTIGKYQIIDKIGEGGMGTVYRAEDTTLHRPVALKTLSPHLAEDEEARRRFVREAEAASSLNHPNITTIYELLEDEGQHHICMEYVEGRTIREMVEGGRVSVKRAVDIIIQAAEALSAAHDKGILHRDIKSANIMVNEEGRVKVMDFGLAHLEDKSQLTRTGTTMGTLSYSSPETVSGKPADESSEIFSLGVVFYELLTGQLPFQGSSEAEIVLAIISGKQPSITEFRGDVSDNLEAVVFRMLEKKPELRYQNCGELIGDLKAVRSTLETTTVGRPVVLPALRAKRRRQLAIGLAAFVITAGTAFILLRGTGGVKIDPDRVIVAVFNNHTADDSLDQFGHYIAQYITGEIDQTELLHVEPYEHSMNAFRIWMERAETGEISDPIKAFAEEAHTGVVVLGDIYQWDENRFRIQASIRDIIRGKTTPGLTPITGSIDDKDVVLEDLRQQILGALAVHYNRDFELFIQNVSKPHNYEAMNYYTEGLRTYFGQTGLIGQDRRRDALPLFLKAFTADSTFVSPLIWAIRMSILLSNGYSNKPMYQLADSLITITNTYREGMQPYERYQLDAYRYWHTGDLIHHSEILCTLSDRFPGTFHTFDAAQWLWQAGRPNQALRYLDMIDPYGTAIQTPQWWYEQRTFALAVAGEHRELERHVDKAVRILAPDPPFLRPPELGQALGALNRRDRIYGLLEEMIEHLDRLDFATYEWTAVRIAENLKYYGYMETFEEFTRYLEEQMESFPSEVKESRSWLVLRARILILNGRFQEAYEIARALNDRNPLRYNMTLGVTAAGLGYREEALLQIERIEELYGTITSFQKHQTLTQQAAIYAHLGEPDRSMQLLAEGFKYHPGYQWWLSSGALLSFEPLWDLPRFKALVHPKG